MARILLFLLKCIVGLFAAVGFLLVAAVVAVAFFVPRIDPLEPRLAEVPENTVLVLDLSQGLIEERPDNPLARASLGSALVLREAIEALEGAGRDERVKALVIRAGWGEPGLAQMQELRAAVVDFRAAGKPVVAFAETFGEVGNGSLHYFLASAAGEIWMQPSGDLDITGFALEQPFLRPLLQDIGARAQVAQREEYKGAMSFLTEDALPAPQRQNLQRYLDSAIMQITTAIAEARNLEARAVRDLIDRAPYRGPQAVQIGLIDRLGYWDEVEAAVNAAAGTSLDNWLALGDYRQSLPEPDKTAPVIALVHGLGPIILGESAGGPLFGSVTMAAVDVAEALSEAIDDPEVEAIVFRVDSPGGSYVGSDTIWREVQRARELGKPVVVSMGNLAASGGYFVAAPAERIVAQPGTITGSIGVISGKVSLQELWDEIGVNWDGVQAGQRAGMWSPNRPFSSDEWDWLQQTLDATYADFTGKVAAGRGLTHEQVLAVAKGQIWSGADAKDLGLIDALGGYRTAIALAKDAAALPADSEVRLRPYPAPRDPFAALLEDTLGRGVESAVTLTLLRSLARAAEVLAPLVQVLEGAGDLRSRTLQSPALIPAP